MVVVGEFRVDVRPYSGYEDPSLPIGAWVAQGGIAGDASGGDLFMIFSFARDDDAQVTELYNLEQVAIDTTKATGSEAALMDVLNMDQLAFNRPLTDARYAILLADTISGFGVALLEGGFAPLPIWLGAPSRVEGDKGLRFQFDNVDLQLYSIIIQGYIWGPRSVLAPGGPRRPVGGLFGHG